MMMVITLFKGSLTLATFVGDNASNSDECLYLLDHFGQGDTDRIISIYVAPPKVAKASTSVLLSHVIVAGVIAPPSPMKTLHNSKEILHAKLHVIPT